MNILLATPLYTAEWDSGHFVLRALQQLGHQVAVWDYRLDRYWPVQFTFDATIVLQGDGIDPDAMRLPRPRILWHFEVLGEMVDTAEAVRGYDKVFVMSYQNTAPGVEWLPGAYDTNIHRHDPNAIATWRTLYVGTANSEEKVAWVSQIQPQGIIGNGWSQFGINALPPMYGPQLAQVVSHANIALNFLRRPGVGPNRKLFELVPCAFTLTEHAEGIEQILGSALAEKVSFSTAGEARELIRHYALHPEERQPVWEMEQNALRRFTYADRVSHLLDGV